MADFARLGGEHSIEVVQWLAMRGALREPSRMEFNYYYPFGLMGYAIAAFVPLRERSSALRGARSETRRLAGARKRRTKESAMGIRTGRQFSIRCATIGKSGSRASGSRRRVASAPWPGGTQRRVRLFRLAWDVTCSSFAGRQTLYERFFSGDP